MEIKLNLMHELFSFPLQTERVQHKLIKYRGTYIRQKGEGAKMLTMIWVFIEMDAATSVVAACAIEITQFQIECEIKYFFLPSFA